MWTKICYRTYRFQYRGNHKCWTPQKLFEYIPGWFFIKKPGKNIYKVKSKKLISSKYHKTIIKITFEVWSFVNWNANQTTKIKNNFITWNSICESCSVMSNSLWPHGLYSPWNSPGQNTGVVAFPFSRYLPNPGIEPTSPALKADSLPAEPPGKPQNSICSGTIFYEQV